MARPIPIPPEEYADDPDARPLVIAEHQAGVDPLPAVYLDGGEQVWTRWSLTEEERRVIAETGVIDLRVWTYGKPLQPLLIETPTPSGTVDDERPRR